MDNIYPILPRACQLPQQNIKRKVKRANKIPRVLAFKGDQDVLARSLFFNVAKLKRTLLQEQDVGEGFETKV